MLSRIYFVALLTAQAAAAPSPQLPESNTGTVQILKRDAPLEARHLELSEAHGVNLTEMYMHSFIKRDDGDHMGVWINRGFQSTEGPALEERGVRLPNNAYFARAGNSQTRWCGLAFEQGEMRHRAAFTGGIAEMRDWLGRNPGFFQYTQRIEEREGRWRHLIVAGSNTGANAVFLARKDDVPWNPREQAAFGTKDMQDIAIGAHDRGFRDGQGRWRGSARGRILCRMPDHDSTGLIYELRSFDGRV